eukprot:jgi/Mesvir1/11981/Mv00294-RA.2
MAAFCSQAMAVRVPMISSAAVSSTRPASAFWGKNVAVRPQAVSMGKSRLPTVAKVREIFMPALSSTMTEGKIVSWAVSEGDVVKKGNTVVVVESDKADMDVETFYDGIVAAILVGEGESGKVGAPIGLLCETEAELDEARSKAASLKGGSPMKAAGVPAAAPAAAAAPPPPPPPPRPAAAPAAPVAAARPASPDGRVIASPFAKKRAIELGVDISTIVGTGVGGRIVEEDVVRAAAAAKAAPAPAAAAPRAAAPAAAPAAARSAPAPTPAAVSHMGGKTQAFTGMQTAVARNMEASLAVPEFRVGYTIGTDALDALYKKLKSKGVTMTALLAKAVAVALAEHPVINARCEGGAGFLYNEHINIAVAVAMDGGLITPVLKEADKMDIYSLSREWASLVSKARSKSLAPSEYSTGDLLAHAPSKCVYAWRPQHR